MRRKALVSMLELIKPALADQAMIPVFQDFVFTGKDVYAFNDALGIRGPCKTGVDPFACHGDTMLGLLTNLRDEEVTIEFERNDVVLIAGKSKMRLPFLPESEFIFKEPRDNWAVEMDIDDSILEAMEICLTTAGKDASMPALVGVTLNIGDGISFYSSDGDAVTHYLIDGANDTDEQGEFIMPSEFCDAIMRICKADKSRNGKLFVSDQWAYATIENEYEIFGRILKADNPMDHAASIEKELRGVEPIWMDIPEGLEHALNRARVIGESKSAATMATVKEGRLTLFTVSDIGEVRDVLRLPDDQPDISFKFDAKLMARSIAVCSKLALLENSTVYRKGQDLFQIVGNRGDN